jgi:hypothetical protein
MVPSQNVIREAVPALRLAKALTASSRAGPAYFGRIVACGVAAIGADKTPRLPSDAARFAPRCPQRRLLGGWARLIRP